MKFSVLTFFLGALLAVVAQTDPIVDAPIPPNLKFFVNRCRVSPLGDGFDDTDQVLDAIDRCSHSGITLFTPGVYNITRKMTWTLTQSRVEMTGAFLNFNPNITYWLDPDNTYRAIFIQSQASWFIITGEDFIVDAGGAGGIQGNGQLWWNFFATRPRADGDGRPVSLSLVNATRGIIRGFQIQEQPFWCNAVSMSQDILYDGMFCNATNTNPQFAGTNLVPNTDGIDTYRSNRVALLNWDITCGDDCIAIKGNSTNVLVSGIICRGGNGIAIGSLGQYIGLNDTVENVIIENAQLIKLPPSVQPNLGSGIYFKTWTGAVNGVPPTGGGGAGGLVANVLARNFTFDPLGNPVHVFQTNGGHSGDAPSTLQIMNLTFDNFQGTTTAANQVNLQCSPAVPCPNMIFTNFNVSPPPGVVPKYTCANVISESGLPFCTPSGIA